MRKLQIAILAILVAVFCTLGAVNAAEVDLTGGATALPLTVGKIHKITESVDASTTNLTATDTYKVIYIPAESYLVGLEVTIDTAESGNCTIDIGDSSSGTLFWSSLACNATSTNLISVTGSTSKAKAYSTANKIVLDPDHAMDEGALTVTGYIMQ